jgi:molecular chaperone GrpE
MSTRTEPERPEDLSGKSSPDGPLEGTQDAPQNEASLPEADVIEEPEEQLSDEERVLRERDEFEENWRRSQADFQNLRRRQSEVIAASRLATKRELLGELLLVIDYLDMALITPMETQEGKNLYMGVSMTRDQMMQFLVQREVEPIDTGGNFDPSLHEAVETIETDEAEPGTILQTARTGYTLGKDVLRHAHVKVAAAPKTPQTEAEGEGSAAS